MSDANRRKEDVVVPSDWGGRDAGKVFRITEMDALRADKWGSRMFLAVKGTAGFISEDVARLGMVGVAIRGLNAFLASDPNWQQLEPLLDEMLDCVQRVRDLKHPEIATALISGDIEEYKTPMWLRSEVLRVHTGFSFAAAMSSLLSTLTASAALPST